MYPEHDGALTHNTSQVTDYLPQRFGDRWRGDNRPDRCLARPPDLNVLDTFVWGLLKKSIYWQRRYQKLDQFERNIIREFGRLRTREIHP